MAAKSSRPRGYMHGWTPQPHVADLIENAETVIDQYRDYGAMTVRQIFYRLVGQFDYPKDERAYARLCETLVKARRAGMIEFGSIRDEPEEEHLTGGYDSPADWWRSELVHAEHYQRDPHEGQDYRVELWCEAAGMAPMLAQMVRRYGVDVYSTGGFSSVTVTYNTAQRVLGRDVPTILLHVGDYDPSGASIYESMTADIAAFVYGDAGESWKFEHERVALTQEQVTQYDLPTAPPKKSDTRSNNWHGETCQLEAMDPATLDQVVTAAVRRYVDIEQLRSIREAEKGERMQLVAEVTRNIEDR